VAAANAEVLGGVATLEVEVVFRASVPNEFSTRDVVMLGGNEEIERAEPTSDVVMLGVNEEIERAEPTRDVVMLGVNEDRERAEPGEEVGKDCWFNQPRLP